MAVEVKARTGQDSFLEALRSEIVADSEILSAWISSVQAKGGTEVLFEFETWLRGLMCHLNHKHLPLEAKDRADLITRSFAPEIRVARLALQECEQCTMRLFDLEAEAKPEAAGFSDLRISRVRGMDFQVGKMFDQSIPMDSLTCLLDSMNDLKVMMDAAAIPASQNFQLYLSIGRTLQRNIRDSRFVDMLLKQRFRIQYDRVDSAVLSGLLRAIPEEHLRRNVALALLHLNRFLRYLKPIAAALAEDRPLRRFLVVFSLLHEQSESFCDFLKSRFLKERRGNPELQNAADLTVHSLRMELERIFERELPSVSSSDAASVIYAKIENSHGLLRNCYQSCIVTLAQAFDRDIEAKTIFPTMLEGQQQGQRLQMDLWSLRQDLKAELDKTAAFDLDLVLDRLMQFRESSLRNLMYKDWKEFENISESLITAGSQAEVRALLRKFLGFLEFLMREVAKRSVLRIPATVAEFQGEETV